MSHVAIKQEPLLKPDHGENFVPGSESAPDHMAPQPLDHFKRGYKERADLRDREMDLRATHSDSSQVSPKVEPPCPDVTLEKGNAPVTHLGVSSKTPAPTPPPPIETRQHQRPTQSYSDSRASFRGSVGFDAVRLVEALCRPGCDLVGTLDHAKDEFAASFQSGKALTAILSNLARRRKMGIALSVWQWMEERSIEKNVYHFNSLISVCEKMKDNQRALRLLEEMDRRGIQKNEVTFSSAISACEKAGQWRVALDLLDRMKREGIGRTAIAYNAAISACEKGLVPHKALELFEQMKSEGVVPTVVTYSALISAAEKGQQWKLALEVLDEMKASGHGANVIAYSAAISALSKGQMWEKALELFREIERSGNTPSIVTYNATMTALEKGLQWERALDLFDEMKAKRLPITVVSYGSAISACEKGLQYRQCLEYLDEMTELGIKKNVIIFGAAMSCMEKCCRADIAFQLMDRMKMEGVAPNVHIFNSAISACARCNLWSKGLELFEEMETVGVIHDVVSFNAVLDAVSSQVHLGRRLFELGIEKGFYARVSRLGTQWLELDLHFLSLGGGEIALGWWFEECLVPYLVNTSKLAAVTSIDIVTGYGKTRMRGIRHGDDGMRKRVRAMLEFMGISEIDQPNKGRIHIDKEALIREVQKNGGKILFDYEGYNRFKEQNTTANHTPDVIQQVRPRYSGPLPIQVDRRPPVNQLDGHDRRRSFDNPRRESSHTHRGPVKPNLDSTPTSSFHSVSAASSYGDRHGRRGVNGSSNQRRGSFDGYGSHSSDRNTEQQAQLKYGENEHLSSGHSLNHGSHVNSQSSDYDRRNATDWHHGLSHRRSHKDSHDQHVGARREWQQQHQNQTRNSSPYPGKDQRSGNTINIGERQFIQENQEVSYPHDAYHDNRSGVLLSRRWERANSVAQYEDNANSHFDTKTEQNTYPDHSERGNRPQNHHEQPGTDRSHVSQVPNETNLDYKTERRRGSQHLGMYRKHDEPRNSGHREGDMRNRHYTNHEDGHDWRHQSHVVDGYGGRGHQKNSRNDFERWDDQPNDFYSERRSSQAPSHGSGWEASHNREHGNYSINKANVSQRETGEFLSQDERKVANFQDEKLDSSVGGKRPFDGGERPAAKRRGYDINPSTSFVQGSRGY